MLATTLTTLRYSRRALLSWCWAMFAMGRRPKATSVVGTQGYLDLEAPVSLSLESIAQPWRWSHFLARVPRPEPDAGNALLDGILLRTDARQSQVQAFCLLCPHEICRVEYRTDTWHVGPDAGVAADHPLFMCPCHFSIFDPAQNGARISGPANRGLYRFRLKVEQETVHITQVEEEVLALFDAVSPPREER